MLFGAALLPVSQAAVWQVQARRANRGHVPVSLQDLKGQLQHTGLWNFCCLSGLVGSLASPWLTEPSPQLLTELPAEASRGFKKKARLHLQCICHLGYRRCPRPVTCLCNTLPTRRDARLALQVKQTLPAHRLGCLPPASCSAYSKLSLGLDLGKHH